MPRRKFWGWGNEGAGPSPEQERGIVVSLSQRFGAALELAAVPRVDEIALAAPRAKPPDALRSSCSDDPHERLGHTYGKGFRDVVRALRRDFAPAPDWVAFPRDEAEVAAVLDWCTRARLACIPYGGGSSVAGGVEARGLAADYAGVVSLDLGKLARVVEIDRSSRAARIQAGVLGPALEDQLRPHGLTLRHYPQSFEFSSLGGWIATRSGGHYASLYTHIDDFVESLRVVTPSGVLETRRLPGSGAGPAPDRLFIGSEGTLGVITEAWMRLQDRPRFRSAAAVRFAGGAAGFTNAAEAARQISQAGLFPSNCRLLDALEAANAGAGNGDESVLLVAFESADHALDAWMARALEIARGAGGVAPEHVETKTGGEGARDGAAGAWRNAFVNAPYLRDVLCRAGVVSETFETAITWDRFTQFHAGVTAAVGDAIARVCGSGTLSCRFTHVYPDGPAPYYTILAPGRRGGELEQWDELKAAAMEALIRLGGTITHHHAVGRDHRPGYDREVPALFTKALAAAKSALDPAGVMNPGVLIDAPAVVGTNRSG